MTLVRSKNGGNFRQSVIMSSKGLLNNPGENNCFMNSAVQVLWHLDVFRRSFRLLNGHTCLEDCCIFCALKEIFERFQESDEAAQPPDVLRIAMAKAFKDQQKFQIGRMGDAAECFENILRRLHYHIAYGTHEDACNAKHCIPHQKFAMQILEQTFCRCGATSEPLNFFQIVNYVSASALIDEANRPRKDEYRPSHSFGELLRVTSSLGESRPCPDDHRCAYKEKSIIPTKVLKSLLNCPDIVVIGINWDTDRPTAEYIMDLLDCLGNKLDIKDLFDNVIDEKARKMRLRVVGIMTYYGKHYTTFFYNSRQEAWFYLDDARVKEIGKDWNIVKDRCIRGRHQPLLVFYANQYGEPIKATKAPKATNFVSKEELLSAQNNNGFARDKDAGKARSSKNSQIDGLEDGERNAAGKRKSFRKMVGSAFKRNKSAKSTKSTRQMRYSADHVLSVNGHDIRSKKEDLNQSLENGIGTDYEEADAQRQSRKSVESTKGRLSPIKTDTDGYRRNDSSTSLQKMNGEVPQVHRLYKHQKHVKSIESSLDVYGDVSDYDNIGSPKANEQKTRKSLEIREKGERKERKIDVNPIETSRYSTGNSVDPGLQKMQQQPRRFIEKGDAFADTIDEAESLTVSSIEAEQEGNLVKSYNLCNTAKGHYKNAMNLEGITNKMKEHAERKLFETQNRSQLLRSKIAAFREKSTISADYDRQFSRTSDYSSLSDASGSPMTQSEFSVLNQRNYKENQQPNEADRAGEKGGIQAKLNKDRKKQEDSKQEKLKQENRKQDNLMPLPSAAKTQFFTIPRRKKHHEHKLSSPDPPTQSEMEQLNALLKNFGSNKEGKGNLETGAKSDMGHKSVPDLDWNNDRLDSGPISYRSQPFNIEPHYDDIKSRDLIASDSDATSFKFEGILSNDSNLRDKPKSRTVVRPIQLKSQDIVVKAESRPQIKADPVKTIVDYRRAGEQSFQGVGWEPGKPKTGTGLELSPSVERNRKLTGKSDVEFQAHNEIERGMQTGTRADIDTVDLNKKNFEQKHYVQQTSKNELNVSNIQPNVVKSPPQKEKKRSIFKVVVPKLMNTDRIGSVKKSKKSIDSRQSQYAAMLDAEARASSKSPERGTEWTHSDTDIRKDGSNERPYIDRTLNEVKVISSMKSQHEDSYIVDPEIAQDEVAKATTQITQQRLFNDSITSGTPTRNSTKIFQSEIRYNDRYGDFKEREFRSPVLAETIGSKQYELNGVLEDRIRTMIKARDFESKADNTSVKGSQRIINDIASPMAERFFMDSKEEKKNDFAPNVRSMPSQRIMTSPVTSPQDEDQPGGKRVVSVKATIEMFSNSESSPRHLQKGPIQPPPRRNLHVYRSSDLYSPKAVTTVNINAARSLPEEVQNTSEVQSSVWQHVTPQHQMNTLSRWTNNVDFSKSARQLCQQCGTVTVEKPRKFCRKCQSDYL